MTRRVVIIGAGMGGLAAAVRLAQQGIQVQVLEARSRAGGLAERQLHDGLHFDAGPYVLLDRPGLEWVFSQLDLDLEEQSSLTGTSRNPKGTSRNADRSAQEFNRQIKLKRIHDVFEVEAADGEPPIRFWDSLDRTADGLEAQWPGSGERYRRFVEATIATYRRLQPLQTISRPGLSDVLRSGGWRDLPFLLRSLAQVLAQSGLPQPVQSAIGIWTHVAGQSPRDAPSPLALVPAVIHSFGAWYPQGGIGTIPTVLRQAAIDAGAQFRYETPVQTVCCQRGRVTGVETRFGEFIAADAVLANAAGLGTYLDLLDESTRNAHLPPRVRRQLQNLSLQSPGLCAYLATRRRPEPPYLRFHLPGGNEVCRLLVQPGVLDRGRPHERSLARPLNDLAEAEDSEAGSRRYATSVAVPAQTHSEETVCSSDGTSSAELSETSHQPDPESGPSTTRGHDGWWPARLIVPMRHAQAVSGGISAQRALLERVLQEPWWQQHVGETQVLATRLPAEWGRQFHLYHESMNPVMTARFMRRGRLAHRSPYVRGLYLAGSATHPGQWVSFCAVSGILAADCLCEDLSCPD